MQSTEGATGMAGFVAAVDIAVADVEAVEVALDMNGTSLAGFPVADKTAAAGIDAGISRRSAPARLTVMLHYSSTSRVAFVCLDSRRM